MGLSLALRIQKDTALSIYLVKSVFLNPLRINLKIHSE
jgi:hypothetical protein